MSFSPLLQHWFRTTARQTVLDAAQNQLAAAGQPASANSPPGPCDFGLVFALAIESGCLVDLLEDVSVTRGNGFTVREGRRNGRTIVLVESGAGREAAARATHALLDAHRPGLVFSAGFAGALSPELRRGDLVVADRLVDPEGRRWAADPASLPPWLPEVRGLRIGPMLTVDGIVRLGEEKRALGAKHHALAVDMESLAVAEVCRERNVPFMAVRVVNDAVDDELPPDIERLLAQRTLAAQLGAAAGSLCRRPSGAKDLFRLQQNALAASDRLAKFLAGVMKHVTTCSTPETAAGADSTPPA